VSYNTLEKLLSELFCTFVWNSSCFVIIFFCSLQIADEKYNFSAREYLIINCRIKFPRKDFQYTEVSSNQRCI